MNPRLALAILLPFASCGLQWLLWDFIDPYVWFLFFPAAYFSAWLGGLRGGLAGTAISALLVWFVFMPPAFSFALVNPASGFSIAVFVAMGALFAWFFERLRKAQAHSEAQFEATFDQAAVGIAHVSPDGRWLRVNRKLCDIVGYSPAELMGKTFQDITHPDDLEADLALVRRLLAREIDTYSLEKRYIRKDGNAVWINLTVALVWNPDHEPDYFIAVIEDIQARKEAEAALQDSERTYRTLFENMMNGYAHCRMLFEDGKPKDFVYLDVNKAFTTQTGLADVIGRKVSEVIPGIFEADPGLFEIYGQVALGGPPKHFEVYVGAMGMWFSIWVHSPKREHFVAIFDVITERKRAEGELRRRNQELESFNQASVGRELEMIELKRRINDLSRELGREAPFDLSFAEATMPDGGSAAP